MKKKKNNEENKFYKNLVSARKAATKILKPRVIYTSEYDMFSIMWGEKEVESTVECNLINGGDLRCDITKEGIIVGIEIENFSEVLKKFDCDKSKHTIKYFKKKVKKI